MNGPVTLGSADFKIFDQCLCDDLRFGQDSLSSAPADDFEVPVAESTHSGVNNSNVESDVDIWSMYSSDDSAAVSDDDVFTDQTPMNTPDPGVNVMLAGEQKQEVPPRKKIDTRPISLDSLGLMSHNELVSHLEGLEDDSQTIRTFGSRSLLADITAHLPVANMTLPSTEPLWLCSQCSMPTCGQASAFSPPRHPDLWDLLGPVCLHCALCEVSEVKAHFQKPTNILPPSGPPLSTTPDAKSSVQIEIEPVVSPPSSPVTISPSPFKSESSPVEVESPQECKKEPPCQEVKEPAQQQEQKESPPPSPVFSPIVQEVVKSVAFQTPSSPSANSHLVPKRPQTSEVYQPSKKNIPQQTSDNLVPPSPPVFQTQPYPYFYPPSAPQHPMMYTATDPNLVTLLQSLTAQVQALSIPRPPVMTAPSLMSQKVSSEVTTQTGTISSSEKILSSSPFKAKVSHPLHLTHATTTTTSVACSPIHDTMSPPHSSIHDHPVPYLPRPESPVSSLDEPITSRQNEVPVRPQPTTSVQELQAALTINDEEEAVRQYMINEGLFWTRGARRKLRHQDRLERAMRIAVDNQARVDIGKRDTARARLNRISAAEARQVASASENLHSKLSSDMKHSDDSLKTTMSRWDIAERNARANLVRQEQRWRTAEKKALGHFNKEVSSDERLANKLLA